MPVWGLLAIALEDSAGARLCRAFKGAIELTWKDDDVSGIFRRSVYLVNALQAGGSRWRRGICHRPRSQRVSREHRVSCPFSISQEKADSRSIIISLIGRGCNRGTVSGILPEIFFHNIAGRGQAGCLLMIAILMQY